MKISFTNQKGFTLLEVMLAMAVFAIAGVALMSAANSNYRHISHIEETMLANWVASNQLVEVNLDKSWPPKNNQKGDVELAGRKWYWQQKVIKTTDKDMRAVTIEVRATKDNKTLISSMTTYVAKETL
jgi:general secretion pathway protein I|tara:strand:+ start:1733 stop:2116 length:384 start_codon:yes stop_codon:yes gene_type:complete